MSGCEVGWACRRSLTRRLVAPAAAQVSRHPLSDVASGIQRAYRPYGRVCRTLCTPERLSYLSAIQHHVQPVHVLLRSTQAADVYNWRLMGTDLFLPLCG